jgi:multicomponent Na+:H+ antiporter subunit F
MQSLYYSLILFLLLTLVAGLWRIRRGPTAADRMLAAQLFGTTATAILLLLAEVSAAPALLDVALVLALLAAITVTAFTRQVRGLRSADLGLADAAAGEDAPVGEADVEDSARSGKPLGAFAGERRQELARDASSDSASGLASGSTNGSLSGSASSAAGSGHAG